MGREDGGLLDSDIAACDNVVWCVGGVWMNKVCKVPKPDRAAGMPDAGGGGCNDGLSSDDLHAPNKISVLHLTFFPILHTNHTRQYVKSNTGKTQALSPASGGR